jgi:glycosyltransferase involved in cell wall biosynthesis
VAGLIPAWNEADRVGPVVAGARAHLPTVYVVDDGSGDGTAAAAEAAGATVLRHPANRGKGAALVTGFERARAEGFDVVVTLDADGQHLPAEIPRLLAAAERADLVVGNRLAGRAGMPLVRWHTNRLMSRIVSRLAGVRIPDSQCGFRCLRLAAWGALRVESRNFDFESEILVRAGRAGLRVVAVPVSTVYNDHASRIRPVTDTVRFFRLVGRLAWRR